MRKLAFISLLAYLMLAMSPFALADELKVCPLLSNQDYDPSIDEDGEQLKFIKNQIEISINNSLDSTKCGEVNSATGFIEKGDCSINIKDASGDVIQRGKVITEVGEVIGPDIDDDGDGNQILTVYKGVCCLVTDVNGECVESRNVYSKDFSACESNASLCERRQWIIGTSGTGIVKIYVKQLYIWGAGVIGFIAVVTMVISGIQISVSGVSGDITEAKERIFKALGGLVLLFLSGLILYTINPTFFS